jgi:prevent-host-death family protein
VHPFWKAKFLRRTRATLIQVTRKLTQRELRNNSGEIMRALDAGEDFIVTRNGKPVGELRPYKPREFMPRDIFLAAFEDAPHIDYEKFIEDIDAYADQDPTPRG